MWETLLLGGIWELNEIEALSPSLSLHRNPVQAPTTHIELSLEISFQFHSASPLSPILDASVKVCRYNTITDVTAAIGDPQICGLLTEVCYESP